ncbi:hypothetical protein AB0L63_31555 [Nocardia sp. NPDC051990]|uniref:hypothetical protein n=1 Tax=Nocardia sp. NPDC051990 TaxID=3155285 RepID=UPI003412F8AD
MITPTRTQVQVLNWLLNQSAALATRLAEAGIAIATVVALPSNDQLEPAISAALTPPTPLFPSTATSGADIDAAIDAADFTYSVDTQTGMEPPTFSDSVGTEPWSSDPVLSDAPVVPSVWQEAEL